MKKYLFLICLGIWSLSCTDPTQLGLDVIENANDIGVNFTDTLSIESTTVRGDSSITFRRNDTNSFSGQTYMVGKMEDEKFGNTEAITYFDVSLRSPLLNFRNFQVDSVVISLRLDTLGQYGNENAIHNLQLFELSSVYSYENGDTVYSNEILETQSTALFEESLTINDRDSIEVNSFLTDTIVKELPQIRIPFDVEKWKAVSEIATDSIIDIEKLQNALPGFALKSEPDENSIFGLNLSNTTTSASNMLIYYWPTDTTRAIFRLPLGRFRHNYFQHDYENSEVEIALDNSDSDYLYLQSQAGTNIEIDIPEIANYKDNLLNFASLELTIEREDTGLEPINQLFAFFENEEEVLVAVRDLSNFNNSTAVFDGGLSSTTRNGNTIEVYNLNITDQLNDILDGEIESTKITLVANAKAQRPGRTIILGANDPLYPPRLKVVLTNP